MKEQRSSTQIAQFFRSNRRKRNWRKVVTSMAAVVVFCVTYALILPAITMEAKPVCGLEEHTHTDECYEIVRTLVCENTDEDHEHTEECWKVEQKLVCGLEEHIHTEACYAKEAEPEASEEPGAEETEEAPVPEAEPLKAPAQEPVVRSAVFEGANGFVYVEGKAPAGTPEDLMLKVATLEEKDTEAERTALGAAGVDLGAEGTRAWFFMPQVSHADTQVTLSGPVSVRLRINGVSAANDPHVYMFSAGNAAVKEITVGEDNTISFTTDALGCTALVYKEAAAPEVTPEPTAEPTPEVTPEPTAEPVPEVTPEPTVEPAPEATPAPTEAPAGTPAPTEVPAAAEEEAGISEYSFTFEDPSAYLSNILKLSGAKLKGEYAEISVEPAGLVYLDKRDEQIKTGLFGMKKLGEEQLLTAVTSFDKAVLVLKNENEEVRIDLHNPKTEADFVPFTGEANGISVCVQAPAGALPEGTEMLVLPVNDEKLLNIAGSAVDGEVKSIVAVDISFWNDGEEIEPILPVQVKLTSDFIRQAEDPQIVHVPDKGTVEVISTDAPGPEANDITFASKTFSVYAVVETGHGGDNARATVNFYGKDTSNPIATVFVKNSDEYDAATDTGKLKDIVYDPGNGELESTELFDGWSISTVNTTDGKNYALIDDDGNEIKGKTIEDVRKYLAELDIKEGDVVNIYARIVKYYTVTYIGETPGVVLGSETQKLLQTESTIDYTVNMAYTPATNTQNFDGWFATQGSSNISQAVYGEDAIETPYTSTTLFPNGTTMKLSGNVQFSVSAPAGHWLVFDENGKGATYNAPQFIKDGDVTSKPALEMIRLGYRFDDWYTVKYADNETPDPSKKFTFGDELSDNTTIYAKWNPVTEANYTVIIWKESMTDTYANNGGNKTKNYDFAESFNGTGTVGEAIPNVSLSTTSFVEDGDGDPGTRYYNAVVDDNTISYTGFHCSGSDDDIIIKAEGNAVLNIYYDRNTVTYTFYTYGSTAGRRILCTPNSYTEFTGTIYVLQNGEYVTFTETPEEGATDYYYMSDPGNPGGGCSGDPTPPTYTKLVWRDAPAEYQWNVYQNEIGLYGESLNWPADTSIWWYEKHNDTSGTGTRMTYKSAFLPLDSDMTVEYYGTNGDGNAYIHFWTQNADGTNYTDQQQVATGSGNVTFYINDKFTGFYAYQYRTDNGSWQNVGTFNEQTGIYGSAVSYNSRLDIRYNRIKGVITFLDGSYFDGNNNVLEETRKGDEYLTSPEYYYQADISSYNSGGADYYIPDPYHSEYTFAGWYADDTCTVPYNFTTMPATGATVYAKWILNQYRVFLHPNAGTDPTLDWGSDNQDINFRVSSGSKVSAPTGTRLEYEFIGWYLDEACTQVFSADNFVLNETTVTAPYDKTDPANYTDPMDKWGNNATWNSDAQDENGNPRDRFWITKKFDLYAKWRAILVGADGIGVVYDLNGGSGSVSDTNLYPDNTKAIAQGAATPADDTQQFLYWVVQEWDEDANNGEGAYADTDLHVYPGANYTVLKSLARDVLEGTDSSGKEIHSYTMHLRAQYGPKEEATPTHITWYDNFTENPVEGTNYITESELQINEAVDIEPANRFSRPGYKFLGWARVNTTRDDGTALDPAYELAPRNLTEEDLFLIYDEEENAFTYNGTTVTQVAADEVFPYHDLYAVWSLKSYTVTVVKNVSSEADKDIPFEFTPRIDGIQGEAFTLVGNPDSATAAHIKEYKGDNSLPYGTKISITETANSAYSVDMKYTVTNADDATKNVTDQTGGNGEELTIEGDVTITFTNTKIVQNIRVMKIDGLNPTERIPLKDAVLSFKIGDAEYSAISGEDGIFVNNEYGNTFPIPLGDYTVVESSAPAGYIPLRNPVEVSVTSAGVSAISGVRPIEVVKPEGENYYVVYIPNDQGIELPSTGGSGNVWLYMVGALMVLATGSVLLLKKSRKEYF